LTPVEVRFWEKVTIGDIPVQHPDLGPCWVWTGFINPNGYGRFYDGRKVGNAHRIGFVLQGGTVAPKEKVLHRCNNPPCIRRLHLRAGTQFENVQDREARFRPKAPDPVAVERLFALGAGERVLRRL